MELGHFDLIRYLLVLPLFSDFTPPELARVVSGCQLRRYVRNDTVFRIGDPCDEFFVVVTGQVKLFAISSTGQEKVVELIGPGNTFAEALMFLGKPFILNAQALSDTLLISVSKQAVIAEIEHSPRFSMRMLAGISRRLHGLVHDVEAYALYSGLQRVIGYLLRDQKIDDTHGENDFVVSLSVSKATLASRLSLTPEYFSRVLHELESQGLIEIDKRDIRILDARRLSSYGLHLQ
jgi:CRP-like cAMP-binding protein